MRSVTLYSLDFLTPLPLPQANEIVNRLESQCAGKDSSRWTSPWCSTLWWQGHVERDGVTPCCGFGYKVYHRTKTVCELDVLVLGLSGAPYLHGKGRYWPPWNPVLAPVWNAVVSWALGRPFLVIPEASMTRHIPTTRTLTVCPE